ncbi:MAG: GNAT family N-acetyltransferase [Bryobacterales bacterium]|nr:GNAT family N-acetyltransferase [Bryobacterales bacterium]
MDIRAYLAADRDGCLAVFDSNGMSGREEFTTFLNTSNLYVAEHNGTIVGCGGFLRHGDAAELRWGMVGSQWQRQGVGRFLLFYRLREISKDPAVRSVFLETGPAAAPFFLSQGFHETARNGDRIQMAKRLTVCA